jgi:hypothetical protein
MLEFLEFDQRHFRRPCYRLHQPISDMDWLELEQSANNSRIFADLKVPASDLEMAQKALAHSFRRICTQVRLMNPLTEVEKVGGVMFCDRLPLSDNLHRKHAEHFFTSRFRQDPCVPKDIAIDLYTAWITNSLGGSKHVAAIGINFCSFADLNGIRQIDLLSVIEKRRGYGTRIMQAVAADAKSKGLDEVWITTEVENEAALKLYLNSGFDIKSFLSVFHFS